eukprot:Blabericola_migrator_1__4096@NODE_2248_length_3059_cov_226_862634_g1416_i0_p3_GENE_NODE_2248_length_3059_cov_226_862634_g1416_i0NODE_2248_length_3059_cov_226_862634_g1416_i0_p3_ORF_typecomplete_len155_score22_79DUF5357/PF17310_2/0_15_NODE_2248_length_3059_cov_226_862634_g1416_i023732837
MPSRSLKRSLAYDMSSDHQSQAFVYSCQLITFETLHFHSSNLGYNLDLRVVTPSQMSLQRLKGEVARQAVKKQDTQRSLSDRLKSLIEALKVIRKLYMHLVNMWSVWMTVTARPVGVQYRRSCKVDRGMTIRGVSASHHGGFRSLPRAHRGGGE